MAKWKLVAVLALGTVAIGALAAALGWQGEFSVLALAAGAGWAVWWILPDQLAPSDNLMIARASADVALANEQANTAEAQVNDLRAQMIKGEWEKRQLSDRLVEAMREVEAARLEAKNAAARVAEPTLAELEAEIESLTDEHGQLANARDKAQDDFLSAMEELLAAKERIGELDKMLACASDWYEEMNDKLTASFRQVEVAQDQLAQTLAAIRAVTGIDGDLSAETAEEMLRVWKEHFISQTILQAEADMRTELQQLQHDHQALADAHHELLANLGKDLSANPALALDAPPSPNDLESN